MRRGPVCAAASVMALWGVAGCAHTHEPLAGQGENRPTAVRFDRALDGGGTAALSECGASALPFPGPRPPKDSATPQMVVRSYGYSSTGAHDAGRITINLSVAAGSARALVLSAPLGPEGPGIEIRGRDGVMAAAYGLPVKVTSRLADGVLRAGTLPLEFEVALPAAATCPGHRLRDVMKSTTASGGSSATLTVTISDPAIGRHRAAHGVDASSDLLVASWPPDPSARADGAGVGSRPFPSGAVG